MDKSRINLVSLSPVLFSNKLMEAFTWSNPVVIAIIFLAVSGFSGYYALTGVNNSLTEFILLLLCGFVAWTFAEYMIHRFVYHHLQKSKRTYRFKYVLHGVHHEFPKDKGRIVVSPLPAVLFSALLVSLFYLILGNSSFSFTSGFFLGYTLFMSIHYIAHVTRPPKFAPFFWRYHHIHHYRQPDKAYGVITSVWDRVFGTYPIDKRKVELEFITNESKK